MLKYILAISALASSSAFAAPARPLLMKSQDAGYTMPQYFQSFNCSIFADRIEIKRSFGQSITTSEIRRITLAGNVTQLITQAKAEAFTSEGTMCDAPGTRVTAFVPGASGQDAEVLLYGKSTCSQDGTREGESSTVLLNMANALCGSM